MPDGAKPDLAAARDPSIRGVGRSKSRRTGRREHAGSVGNRLAPVQQSGSADQALAVQASALNPADIAIARNGALQGAGYPRECRIGRKGYEDGGARFTEADRAARNAALVAYGVQFTPGDQCMTYAVQVRHWESFTPLSEARKKELFRPHRILIADKPATDKRGRVRKWGSSQAALAEARRIERAHLGIAGKAGRPKKPAPPPGPLLVLMEQTNV